MNLPVLSLRKNEERRLKAGHLWVFSNEVDTTRSPLTAFEKGQEALIATASGAVIGIGYVNPGALISARVLSTRRGERLDADFFRARLADALALRERLYDQPFYRLCYGEGDYLPGLVVDRYDGVCVVQMTTAGMEVRKDLILTVLDDLLSPRTIIVRNDAPVRELEGLDRYTEVARGSAPETLTVREGQAVFSAPALTGQKTGWFYDQRDNRLSLLKYAPGRRVLDVFAYVGAFGVNAALAGASDVLCLDSSDKALAALADNAARNGATGLRTEKADAGEAMERLAASGERFEVVSLDPPALVKRKKDLEKGLAAYTRLIRQALRLLTDDGVLMACSCSRHVEPFDLRRALLKAGQESGARLQILGQGYQGPDHPIHPAMPETEYLKTFTVRARRET